MEELITEIESYYSYQSYEIVQTNKAIKNINRFLIVNNKEHLSNELKKQVKLYGSIGFMKFLNSRGLVKKAKGYCDCNGGTWTKA